jgi:hypothetical protein
MVSNTRQIVNGVVITISVILIIVFAVLYAEFEKNVSSYEHVDCKVVNKTIENTMCLKKSRSYQCGCYNKDCGDFIQEHKNGTCCEDSCCLVHNKPAGQSGRFCVAYSSHRVSVKWYNCKKVILNVSVYEDDIVHYSYKCGMYNIKCLSKFDDIDKCYYNGHTVRFSSPDSSSKREGFIAGIVIFGITLLCSIIDICHTMYKDGRFDEFA